MLLVVPVSPTLLEHQLGPWIREAVENWPREHLGGASPEVQLEIKSDALMGEGDFGDGDACQWRVNNDLNRLK